IEANQQRVADLTVNAALRLLKPKTTRAAPRRKLKPIAAGALNSLAWSDAAPEARVKFIDAVGLQALFAAAPIDHRQQFRAWLLQQDQPPAVEQPRPDAPHIPDDLSVPDFLKRECVPEQTSTL